MGQWVRLCTESDVPAPGHVAEFDAAGVAVCLANINGELHSLDNWCPHRRAPLGQGWVEGKTVVCPWHSWAFDVRSGAAGPPENSTVAVFPVRREDGAILVDIS